MTTDELIKECLIVDEADPRGLRWIWHPSKRHRSNLVNSFAGCMGRNGYFYTKINGRMLLNHRIMFFLTNKRWPNLLLDHINGIRCDNRLCNLREIDHAGNQQNSRRKGYVWSERHRKWRANIKVDGVQRHLGYFATEKEAKEAYLKAKKEKHPFAASNVFSNDC